MLTLHRVEHIALYLIGGVAAVFLPLVLSCPVFVCLFFFLTIDHFRGLVVPVPKLRRESVAKCEVAEITTRGRG